MGMAPVPSSPTTTVPMPIPRVTPIIIWTERCARSTLLIDKETAAAIGAKNGGGGPHTACVRYQARPAAPEVCTRVNQTLCSRSKPARAAPYAADGTVGSEVLMTLAYPRA